MGPDPDNVDTVNAYMWPDTSLDQFGIFGEAQFSLGSGARLTAGLRYDRVEADARMRGQRPAVADARLRRTTCIHAVLRPAARCVL
jgi:outer membrane receptor protein involved in Fe transport